MSARRFGTRIDLQNNEILNMIFQKVNGLPTPTTALQGAARFNTGDGRFYVCTGTAWVLRATDSDALSGFSPAQLRDRSTHTGTQTAASISDFAATVNARRLSDFTLAPTAAVPMGGQKITGLADGSSSGDAINFGQLDAVKQLATKAAAGIAIKEPVIAATTANIDLTSTTPSKTVDGVTIPTNGRVLVMAQTLREQNGIYIIPNTGAMVRAQDSNEAGELVPGTQVFVNQGATNGDAAYAIVSDVAITPGSSVQDWTRVPGSSGAVNHTFGAGLQVVNSVDVQVKAGLGITVADGSVAIDYNLVPRGYKQAIPAGTSPVAVNHGLNSADLIGIEIRDLANGDLVEVGVTVTGVNTVSLDFAVNPVSNQYRAALAVI